MPGIYTSYLLCKKLPQAYQLKATHAYELTASVGQESRESLAVSSASESHRLQSSSWSHRQLDGG